MVTKLILSLLSLHLLFFSGCSSLKELNTASSTLTGSALNIAIPTAGNSWVMQNGIYTSSDQITAEGIRHWVNPNQTIRTFFHVKKAGDISLGIRAKISTGVSKIKVTFGSESKNITLQGSGMNDTRIGAFQIDTPGYYFVDLKGLEKDGAEYADIDAILLGGFRASETRFIKDDFYFARRGPSVHLNFAIPNGVDQVEWFYSEITVPKNQDVIGSYFMANGFGEGYFGIQVNAPTERRILFSVWSPHHTDKPDEIPEDAKVVLLKKGVGVSTGEFGNEGSGGQSYKVFPWKTDVTYGFLLGAQPTGKGSTDYIAYFHDPEAGRWQLIAQFRRPKTNTYLTKLYSFLENFYPDQGVIARKGLYGNQWIYHTAGWQELTSITLTADATARKENRLDYSGGVEGHRFFLKNCGFTNDKVVVDSTFERTRLNVPPAIDFSSLK